MPCTPHIDTRSSERGSALIEVMVSAVILLAAAVSLFLVLDAQGTASSSARSASAAANVAEADQERLRAFRVSDLANRNETRTVDGPGGQYTVVSRTDWVQDASGGTQSCSTDSTASDYLRLTSTVTPPSGGAPQPPAPIIVRSIVAAPVGQYGAGQGTLAVSTVGGNGLPVQGLTTTITGPSSFSATSNELGCAVFGHVPVGSYQAVVSATDFVDPSGNATATAPLTASEGTANLASVQYDKAGTINATFDTQLGAGTTPIPSKATVLTAANPKVPTTGRRTSVPSATPLTAITMGSLFPFSSPYTVYSGTCAAANPAQYNANYFATNPGSVTVTPGSVTAVVVREPALRLTVTTKNPGSTVHVRARSVDAGCSDVYDWTFTTGSGKSATLPDPGLPFGNYSVCADSGGKLKAGANAALTAPTGSTPQTIDLGSAATNGTCT